MSEQKAVLIMAYGSPDSLDDVEPYLLDIRGGRPMPPELVESMRRRYAAIGGKSPLLAITRQQAEALERRLNRDNPSSYRVFVGMRHWQPRIYEAIIQIAQAGLNQVTAICMTPFASRMSSGAYHEQLQRAIDEVKRSEDHHSLSEWRDSLTLTKITAWYSHPTFVRALAEKVKQGLAALPGDQRSTAVVLFSAHSLPSAVVEQGDPYQEQFRKLAGLVAAEAGLNKGQWYTCYQSQGAASGRWLGPSLEETIQQVAAAGDEVALVAPIGFLADNVETLYDIDIEIRQYAEELGLRMARTASLNAGSTFIEALYEILQQEIYREQ